MRAITVAPGVANSAKLVEHLMRPTAPGGVYLAGVSSGGRKLTIDAGSINNSLVLENDVVFSAVNANRRHYELAAAAFAAADRNWLGRLISRRVPLDQWQAAFQRMPTDVKVTIAFASREADG